jgi:hypothetical protein
VTYAAFLARRAQSASDGGFEPVSLPSFLFDFQRHLVDWSLRKGRAAVFADCGLGKTPMQLVWADNVVRHTARPVLVLTPIAVAAQTVSEAEKFGIDARRAEPGKVGTGIHVTNYERLHHYNPDDFAGVVCDESSILKNFDGATKAAVTEFMRRIPYRLLCTATAAPNDFVELGTSSEALGLLGHMDMLNRFFRNDRDNSSTGRAWAMQGGGQPKWRFKGHAEQPFWRWVCSWARSIRKPSDLGFSDGRFALPPLVEREHVVRARMVREGFLFSLPSVGLAEQREERKRTIAERCEMAAELVANTGQPAVMWCQGNAEGDMLERIVADAIQVSGADSDEEKEEKFTAFSSGQARVLVTKPIIGAWGLNWQHCAHMTSFASHSFEQYYQSVRRCWRFGQTRPVTIDHVVSDGESRVLHNLNRKAEQADRMFANLTAHMNSAMAVERSIDHTLAEQVPSWL